MPRGGYRPGAGRPKGSKNRPKSATTATWPNIRRLAAAGGETPLDYAWRVLQDEAADPHRRDAMAALLMPFFHVRPGGGND
jgi:hypothetical protein